MGELGFRVWGGVSVLRILTIVTEGVEVSGQGTRMRLEGGLVEHTNWVERAILVAFSTYGLCDSEY